MTILCALGVAIVCSSCAYSKTGYQEAYGLAALQGRPMPTVAPPIAVNGSRYNVTITRVGSNLYQDSLSRVLIETTLCLEFANFEQAVLQWEGAYGNNWLFFTSTKQSCDVKALR